MTRALVRLAVVVVSGGMGVASQLHMNAQQREIASRIPADVNQLPRLHGFRLRGLEMTRLETFVDATFAFAITMLVIAAERVPDDIEELLAAFRNVPAFGASIAVMAIFWRGHWLWSRRYGLEDGVSILVTWVLIFTMLVYIYPLKVIFSGMFHYFSGGEFGVAMVIKTVPQVRALFAAYAIGFIALSLEICALYLRAWQLREPLQLNARERLMTHGEALGWCIPVAVGTLSLLIALLVPPQQIALSGWAYFLMFLAWPYQTWLDRRLKRLPAQE
jgi:uncharacterized membrane protein